MESTDNPPVREVMSAKLCQAQTKFIYSIDSQLDDS